MRHNVKHKDSHVVKRPRLFPGDEMAILRLGALLDGCATNNYPFEIKQILRNLRIKSFSTKRCKNCISSEVCFQAGIQKFVQKLKDSTQMSHGATPRSSD